MVIDEDARRRFEGARRTDCDDPIESFLPSADDPRYLDTLCELVLIEIELSWKRAAPGASLPPSVESYLERFPSLRTPQTGALLFEEDLRAQRRQGSDPAVDSYRRRYAQLFPGATVPASFSGADFPAGAAYSPRLAPGVTIGNLVLQEIVGRGAFADVWRAHDLDLDRDVAVKISRFDLARDPLLMARVRREARSVARLRHPGIVPIYSVDEFQGSPYSVSEFVSGSDLATVLSVRRPGPAEAARWVSKLADAVHYAHQCGIVHRDVKPGNILVRPDGEPLLADFGLAMRSEAEATLTREGDILGTPAYMSPEQARGDNESVDGRSDVYSLGAVLYEMLCGQRPFPGSSTSILYSVVHVEPPPPSQVRDGVPLDLETICQKAMAKEPDRRYQTAGALAHDLRRYLARKPISARRVSLASRAQLWVRRNPLLAAIVAGACLAIVVVAAIGAWNVLEERDRFRTELHRALTGEAQSLLQSRETSWRWRVMDSVRQAAALPVVDRDPRALRELVIAAQSSPLPCFRLLRSCEGHDGIVTALEIGPQGRLVVSGASDGEVRLWELDSGRLQGVLEGGAARIRGVAFHPGPRLVAAADDDGKVYLWDSTTLELVRTLDIDQDSCLAVAFTPDGSRIACLGHDGRLTVLPADAESVDDAELRIQAHSGIAFALAFTGGGDTIVTAGADRLIRSWDADTGMLTGSWRTHDPARALTPLSAGSVIAYASPEDMGFCQLVLGSQAGPEGRPTLHDDSVHELAWAGANGLVTASADGSLKCWSAFTELAEARGGFGAVFSLGVNPAGDRVAAGYVDGSVRIWELSTPELRSFWRTSHVARFQADAAILVTDLGVFDYSRGMPPTAHPLRLSSIESLSLHPTRRLVALGRSDGEVTVWDLQEERELHRWSVHDGPVVDLEFSPDGARLASVGPPAEGLRVWSWQDGRLLAQVAPGVGGMHDSVWAPDGDALFVTGRHGLALCPVGTGEPVLLRGHDLGDGALARVGDSVVASAPEGAIEVRGARDGELHRTLVGHSDLVRALQLSQSGELLASAGLDLSVRLWRVADWQEVGVLVREGSAPTWLAFGPLDDCIAAGGRADGADLVWDLRTAELIAQLAQRHVDKCAVFDAASGDLLMGDRVGGLSRVSLQAIKEEAEEREPATPAPVLDPWQPILAGGHHQQVWGVATSPDDRWFATSSHDGAVKLWNGATYELHEELQGQESEIAWCLAFSSDSRLLACGQREISLWQVPSRDRLLALSGHERLVVSVAFHPRNASLLFSCALDGTLRLWNTESGQELGVIFHTEQSILDLATSRDGTWLVAGCKDGRVLLWDLRSPAWTEMLAGGAFTPPAPDHRLTGTDSIWAVAVSPDGSSLAGGTARGVVHLWDLESLSLIASFDAGVRKVRSLDWSHDGRYLAAGCYTGSSVTWDLQALRELLDSMGLDW